MTGDSSRPPPFSLAGAARGCRQTLPVAVSVFAFGTVFGLLARQAGLDVTATLCMSAFVFAGSSQLVAIGMWAMPLPVVAIILTTFVVNLRYLLMNAALRPWLSGTVPWRVYGSLFFTADENWAITIGAIRAGEEDRAFLLGSGLTLYSFWFAATLVGVLVGRGIRNPAAYGLDFAFVAVFVALLTGMRRGHGDILPWLIAGAVALPASHLLPGKWYILLGGLAGSLVGAFTDVE